jgi:2,4-dienoyl-CoA reductase-like NADH-dependent reductase (Old Yellow Enzyme family)
VSGKPTITVGSVGLDGEFFQAYVGVGAPKRDLAPLLERFQRGEFDLVAVGRALLQDPAWVEKVREGRSEELKAFDAAALQTLY